MRFNIRWLLLLISIVLACSAANAASAAKRVALVVGNSRYEAEPLANPSNDADSLESVLKALQFQVTKLKDVSKQELESAVDKVTANLAQGDMCLIFYAGHGLQMAGQNYLIPVDAEVTKPQHVKERCVAVSYLLSALEFSGCSLKVIVVDACRNNPFRSAIPARFRGSTGMARLAAAPEGTIVSFSTSPGSFALDGGEGNSPYARNLVTVLRNDAAGTHIVDLFRRASRGVKQQTGQTPYLEIDATMPDYFLKRGTNAPRDAITNLTGMQLKLIPAGSFMMGSSLSPDEVEERLRDYGAKASYHTTEHPLHRVTISKPFYLGIHEVTVGQFRRFVTATGYKTEPETDGQGGYGWNESAGKFEGRDPKYTWQNTGFAQSDSHPVVNVTWNDATAFCEWLSREHNRVYRLPTEAEWEYACRGGTTGLFWNGSDPERLAEIANVADATARVKHTGWTAIQSDDGYVFSAPVGRFPANPFGLYDMHGNVYEWCSDWYGEDYYASSPGTDPQGPSSGSSRVLRGGSWSILPSYVRSAFRYRLSPVSRGSFDGFRVLCESD